MKDFTLYYLFKMQPNALLICPKFYYLQKAVLQAPSPAPRDRLGDFQRTKPLTFSHDVDPLDANDWLQFVERKLQVVQYNNLEKVLLASLELSCPTADWWDAYVEAHEEPESIN
jgi:hypothetical protein